MTHHQMYEKPTTLRLDRRDFTDAIDGDPSYLHYRRGVRVELHGEGEAAGTMHHLEAIEVRVENDVQVAANPEHQEAFDDAYSAVGADGPWMTVPIKGRDYVLVLTPFCQ